MKTRRSRKYPAIGLALVVAAGVVSALVLSTRTSNRPTSVAAGAPVTTALTAKGLPFIVPDAQFHPSTASTVPRPAVRSEQPNGPLSAALAKEVQGFVDSSFVVKQAFDVPDVSAATVVLESPGGTLVVNAQTLSAPLSTSSVVNMGPGSSQSGNPPAYEARADGAAIVSQTVGNGVVLGAARTDGAYVRLQASGVQKAPSPVALNVMRAIAMRHLGLS